MSRNIRESIRTMERVVPGTDPAGNEVPPSGHFSQAKQYPPTHPNTKPTVAALVLCMVILGILLLPLPFIAYKVLKFFLSLGLLYAAGFFLRPCKKLSFTPEVGRGEYGTRNPVDGTFSGTLEDARTGQRLAVLDTENSQIITFLGNGYSTGARSLPPISLQLSLGLVLTAVLMNPLARIHLPRAVWMSLDVVALALLGYAWHLIREEMTIEQHPHAAKCLRIVSTATWTPKIKKP